MDRNPADLNDEILRKLLTKVRGNNQWRLQTPFEAAFSDLKDNKIPHGDDFTDDWFQAYWAALNY